MEPSQFWLIGRGSFPLLFSRRPWFAVLWILAIPPDSTVSSSAFLKGENELLANNVNSEWRLRKGVAGETPRRHTHISNGDVLITCSQPHDDSVACTSRITGSPKDGKLTHPRCWRRVWIRLCLEWIGQGQLRIKKKKNITALDHLSKEFTRLACTFWVYF